MIPIVAIVVSIGLPIGLGMIAILVKHQQKMAEILRQPVQQGNAAEVEQLSREVRELRALMNQQVMMMDSLSDGQKRLAASLESNALTERINSAQGS